MRSDRFARLVTTCQGVGAIVEPLIGDDEARPFLSLRGLGRTAFESGRCFDLQLGEALERLQIRACRAHVTAAAARRT